MSNARRPLDLPVLRRRRGEGKHTVDGRGRVHAMPSILHYGFRPFFFLAALYAGLAVPVWLLLYQSGVELQGSFPGMAWHAHEMLFGYVAAVVAGFILTAIPNWTGRLPLSGWPLGGLVGLWLAGRLATAFVSSPFWTMAIDLAFPVVLASAIWREVIAGSNWRNVPIALLLTLLGLANAAHHLDVLDLMANGLGIRMALAVIAMLLALVGGRVVPSFTRNWLVKQKAERLPAPFGLLDKSALLATAIAVTLWAAAPDTNLVGYALLTSGALLAGRLIRWKGLQTWREPIVSVLHVGYCWLVFSVLLIGAATLWPEIPPSAAIHALTAGAVGTMTLAVMTRASLGHTGRQIRADGWTLAIYILVIMGSVLRVAAPFSGAYHTPVLLAGGGLWSSAFLLFAVCYAPILWGHRHRKQSA